MKSLLNLVTLAVFGLAEGYCFARCGICDPRVFRDQFEFKSFLMMKIFLSAVGFSMISQSMMSFFANRAFEESRFYSYQQVPASRSMVGCFILGAGMYIAGSGPTMAPSQLGSGMGAGPYIVAGMLLGGAIFAALEKTLFPHSIQKVWLKEQTSLDGKAKTSYAALGIPMGLAMVAGAVGFDVFFPHSGDVARYNSTSVVPAPLNPIFAGAAIGLNQIPLRFITGDGQGGSTSVMNVLSTLTGGLFSPQHQVKRLEDLAQFAYVYVGTGLGAYYAAQSQAADGYKPAEGYSPITTVIGAAVMLFGGRYAHGCTCGHGISGMSELSVTSIAGACMIFGGGIAAGLVKTFLL